MVYFYERRDNMKKEKKGNAVLVIILVILLLCALGFIYYGYSKYNELNNKYENLNKKCIEEKDKINSLDNSDIKEQSVVDNVKNYTTKGNYNLYGEEYIAEVIGVNGELYLIESDGSNGTVSSNEKCPLEIVNGAVFTNNKYLCSNGHNVTRLNISESDVYKVNVLHRVVAKDASYNAYIIYKNGQVKLIGHVTELTTVFKNYKVADVKEYCAGNEPISGNCATTGYELTLQDGSTKKVTSLD